MKNKIKIHLKIKEDYKNRYNEEILSYDLSNYILEEIKDIKSNQKIEFIVSSNFTMSDNEKSEFVDMVRNNFGTNISEIIKLSKRENIANILIFITGIFFLILYSLFKINFVSEFILILGWVFIGETICNALYHGIEKRLKIKRRKQIIDAKIVFE